MANYKNPGIEMVEIAPGVHQIQWHVGFSDFLTLRCLHLKYPFFFEPDGEHQIKAWFVGAHDPVALGLVRFNSVVCFPLHQDEPPTPALGRENATFPRGDRDLTQFMGLILEVYAHETGVDDWEEVREAREAMREAREAMREAMTDRGEGHISCLVHQIEAKEEEGNFND